ncbi:hypothetical protein RND81_08G118900 [Saponaria officinalis]|uniref:BAG family molecular chaperone regulator 1 n=1 Tax=Saponaria officinalis TaxID=3572 RepID=A0AAW1J5J0_SAPOF
MKKTNKNNNNNSKMEGLDWEKRPGGMLVQKRNLDSNKNSFIPISTIKILVKHLSFYHEIHINSHATFGDLKKILIKSTGLNPVDQKLIFKDKERDSKSSLNVCGVKDGSKIILVQDIISQENRFLEARRNSNMERALRSVAEVTIEVDNLSSKLKAMERVISKGGRVDDKELLTLIELLMAQMIKLDGIIADGDVKLKRKLQVMRIQKYIESLDEIKVRNATENRRIGGHVGLIVSQQQKMQGKCSSGQINLATKWEKF